MPIYLDLLVWFSPIFLTRLTSKPGSFWSSLYQALLAIFLKVFPQGISRSILIGLSIGSFYRAQAKTWNVIFTVAVLSSFNFLKFHIISLKQSGRRRGATLNLGTYYWYFCYVFVTLKSPQSNTSSQATYLCPRCGVNLSRNHPYDLPWLRWAKGLRNRPKSHWYLEA